jgi:aspartate/methionine/tyrosine aminotransferase
MQGTPEFRNAVAAWLTRRYALPPGYVSAERHILPLAGTKEGLFLASLLAVPETKAGRRPAVLLPNPFFAAYEAVTPRLATAASGSTIPVYQGGPVPVVIRVGDSEIERIQTLARLIEARHTRTTLVSTGAP